MQSLACIHLLQFNSVEKSFSKSALNTAKGKWPVKKKTIYLQTDPAH